MANFAPLKIPHENPLNQRHDRTENHQKRQDPEDKWDFVEHLKYIFTLDTQ